MLQNGIFFFEGLGSVKVVVQFLGWSPQVLRKILTSILWKSTRRLGKIQYLFHSFMPEPCWAIRIHGTIHQNYLRELGQHEACATGGQ